jgi:hypothetical protein
VLYERTARAAGNAIILNRDLGGFLGLMGFYKNFLTQIKSDGIGWYGEKN